MEALLVLLGIVVLFTPLATIYLLIKVGSQSGKLHHYEQLIQELSNRISKLEFNLKNLGETDLIKKEKIQPEVKEPSILPDREIAKHTEKEKEKLPDEVLPPLVKEEIKEVPVSDLLVVDILDYTEKKPETETASTLLVNEQTPKKPILGDLGKFGGENWIGVVGSILLVIGAIFLITYAALQVPPVYRFAIISGFSALVGALGFVLQSRTKWENLAAWLRSIGGALFLFGCLGSGAIPGLQWIDNPTLALGLLSVGIVLNLFLGYLGGKEVFASLHVVLSLTALSMAPHSTLTLLIGGVITLFGIALVFREKWNAHLLVTLTAFFVFHFIWYVSLGLRISDLQTQQHYVAIALYLVIGISAAIVHYQQSYQNHRLEILPFIAHLLNWLYMALAIASHAMGTPWKTLYIALGASAAFFLARKAKQNNITWLYYTDTLLAQIAMLIALLSVTDWQWSSDNGITIVCLMYLEALVFIAIMLLEKERFLYRTGSFIAHLLGLGLLGLGINETLNGGYTGNYLHTAMLLVVQVASVAFLVFMMRRFEATPFNAIDSLHLSKEKSRKAVSIIGLLAGILPVVAFAYLYNQLWAVYAVAGLLIALLYLRNTLQINGLGIGLLAALLLLHYVLWQNVYDFESWSQAFKFTYVLPLLPLALAAVFWSYVQSGKNYMPWPGMYLFVAGLALTAYYFLEPLWAFAPALVWLALSLAALETAKMLHRRYANSLTEWGEPDRYLFQMGYWLMIAFVLRHFSIHTYLQQEIIGIRVRWLVEMAAFATLLYWAMQKPPQNTKVYPLWNLAQPLMPEMLLAFAIGVALTEVQQTWHPVVWIVLALTALLISLKQQTHTSRLRLYALILSWAAAINIIYLSGQQITSDMGWLNPVWLSGAVAILLLFVFVALFYPFRQLQNLYFPPIIKVPLDAISALISRQSMWWIFYPLFIAVAIFLFHSFDKSVLTLWWVAECFVIFSLAIWARENHFRYIAFAGIVVCLVRLVVYDLAQTGTLARALAFLGMGTLLLAMYVVGNRFKERLAPKNEEELARLNNPKTEGK